MKVGDTVDVTIGGHVVAKAEVKELNDGTAVLIVPATRVEFGTRTELTDLPTREPTTEHIVDSAERVSAPVVETAETSETPVETSDTPAQPTPETPVEATGQTTTVEAPQPASNDDANNQSVVEQTENNSGSDG